MEPDKKPEKKKSFWRRNRWLLWLAGSVVIVFLAVGAVLAVVAQHFEPYLRARIVQGMEQRFHAHVELDGFHVSVNNIAKGEWGIWATGTGLRIWPPLPVNGQQVLATSSGQPLISLVQFSFHVPLHWQQSTSIKIGEVDLTGLHVRVPPRSQRTPHITVSNPQPETPADSTANNNSITLLIDRVVCKDTDLTLETDKPGKLPMHFDIPHLTLTHLTPGGAMGYIADVMNPKPKGMIHAEGTFGPWATADPGMSPITGNYHMAQADLGVFRGIGGLLTSDGNYGGSLRDISVTGTANVPDFRLSHFGNAMPLSTRFDARVDGTDGDTWLNSVNAMLGRSQFTTAGQIVRVRVDAAGNVPSTPGNTQPAQTQASGGHVIDLNVNVMRGQIEDFLKLASKSGAPILTGAVAVKAHLLIPPAHLSVEQRMKLDGNFQLNNARFTSDKIQSKIQQLSLRGQGRPDDLKTEDPTLVRSDMHGSFHMAHSVIALPDLDYNVPGADIQLQGSYALDGALNFSGTAKMQATVSQMVTGWKSMLLKPVDKFFQKDGAGTLVPITIKGTREAPSFGVDFSRFGWKGTRAESPATKQQQP